jgi:hypothetical protein
MVQSGAQPPAETADDRDSKKDHKLHTMILPRAGLVKSPVVGTKGPDFAAEFQHGQNLVEFSGC